ncbi:hypothetical protein V6Z11_A12G070000 [Gossypium hirsutum]
MDSVGTYCDSRNSFISLSHFCSLFEGAVRYWIGGGEFLHSQVETENGSNKRSKGFGSTCGGVDDQPM